MASAPLNIRPVGGRPPMGVPMRGRFPAPPPRPPWMRGNFGRGEPIGRDGSDPGRFNPLPHPTHGGSGFGGGYGGGGRPPFHFPPNGGHPPHPVFGPVGHGGNNPVNPIALHPGGFGGQNNPFLEQLLQLIQGGGQQQNPIIQQLLQQSGQPFGHPVDQMLQGEQMSPQQLNLLRDLYDNRTMQGMV